MALWALPGHVLSGCVSCKEKSVTEDGESEPFRQADQILFER